MPNWCWNSGYIRLPKDASPDAKEAFKKLAENKSEKGWFDNVFPTPPELSLGFGSTQGNQEYINLDWLKANSKFTGDFGKIKVHKSKDTEWRRELIPTKEYTEYLKETFGSDNWYGWNNDNWGTKWDVHPEIWDDSEDCINFSFDSAWAPAEAFFDALADRYGIEYELSYHESGCRFAGICSYLNGKYDQKTAEGDEYALFVIKEFDEPIESVIYELDSYQTFDEFIEAEPSYSNNPELLELIKEYYAENTSPPAPPVKLSAVKAAPAKKTAKKVAKKAATKQTAVKKTVTKKKSPAKKKMATKKKTTTKKK